MHCNVKLVLFLGEACLPLYVYIWSVLYTVYIHVIALWGTTTSVMECGLYALYSIQHLYV